MNVGIYKIYSVDETDKFYIGSSQNLLHRKSQHFSMLRLGKHYNTYLQRYYDKHGDSSLGFSTMEYCEASILIDREQFYLDTMQPKFNSRLIAEANRGHKFSAIAKANMSSAQKAWRVGRVFSIKVSPLICDRVVSLKRSGMTNLEISKEVSLSLPTVGKILNGKFRKEDSIERYRRKLGDSNVREIRALMEANTPMKDIATLYQVNPSVISNIKAGRLHSRVV